jgi:hypothetical protein
VLTDTTVQLAIGASFEGLVPKIWERRTTLAGIKELTKYSGLVKALINEKKICHNNSKILAEHFCRGILVKTSTGVLLSSQRSPGPIELARCAVIAIAIASRPRALGKPMLVVSGT